MKRTTFAPVKLKRKIEHIKRENYHEFTGGH